MRRGGLALDPTAPASATGPRARGVRPLAAEWGCSVWFCSDKVKTAGVPGPSEGVTIDARGTWFPLQGLGLCTLPGVPGKAGFQGSREMGSETRNRLRWELLELLLCLLKILHSGSCFPLVSSFISRQEMCMSGQGLMTDRFRGPWDIFKLQVPSLVIYKCLLELIFSALVPF